MAKVSSPTTILEGDTIAKSGLKPLNRSQAGWAPGTLRSQNKVQLLFNCGTINFAIISRMRLCLSVYLRRASGKLQWDKTCLFVWSPPHLGQELTAERFHNFKLCSVGSWFCIAFLVKLKICCGNESITCFQSKIFFGSTVSVTVLVIIP